MSVLYSTVMNLDEKEKVLHIVKKWELLNKGAYYGDAKRSQKQLFLQQD